MSLDQDDRKKRVGIVTTFHNSINYGGVLQAYALQATIQSLGFECDVIRYFPITASESKQTSIIGAVQKEVAGGAFTQDHALRACRFFVRYANHVLSSPCKKLFQKVYLDKKISLRKNAFAGFNSRYIPSTKPYDDETINECIENFDIFVCGSDQIWKPGVFTPTYALGFVPDTKRKIAYAPSIGLDSLKKSDIDYMRPLVNRLDAISVREEQGKVLLEMMTDKDVHWVLDPTLLLDCDGWKDVVCQYPIERPYIFCYVLGDSRENRHFVARVAEKLNMPIVTMPFVSGNFTSLTYRGTRVYDAGPGEFLGLIQNAEYVITDSFHGSVFSILFGKKFVVLKRSSDDDTSSMNSRVYSLLKVCRLESRLVNNRRSFDPADLTGEIDYEQAFVHLNEKRVQSLDFLTQALLRTKG